MPESSLQQRLADLNLVLPQPPEPIASYLPAIEHDGLLYVSGQLPMLNGELLATGPVASQTSVEQAQDAARQCVLNALAIVGGAADGDFGRLKQVVKLTAFVQSDPGFDQQAKVANGASDLLQQLLDDRGRHARAAVGTNALPLNASVEIEFIIAMKK